jgi:hypothetical protein
LTQRILSDISGSHGGEYEDGCLPACASIIRAIIALMMEAASTSESSVNFYQTIRRNNLEDSHLQRSFKLLFIL